MTVIVIFFSLRSKNEAVLEAKEEARREIEEQARKFIVEWLENDGKTTLTDKIDTLLASETGKAVAEIKAAAGGVLDGLNKEREVAHQQNERQHDLIKRLSAEMAGRQAPTQDERKAVEESAKNLEAKPAKDYQSEDWMLLGLNAYWEKKPALAVEYFSKAAAFTDAPLIQAQALYNRGVTLGDMGRHDEAIASYDEVVKRYGSAPEAALREQVAMALNGRGFNLLLKAKMVWSDGDESTARLLLSLAMTDVLEALTRRPEDPIFLGNQGYILFLQDQRDEAHAVLAKAIALGGEEVRKAELADAEVHPLPQDEDFKALINSL